VLQCDAVSVLVCCSVFRRVLQRIAVIPVCLFKQPLHFGSGHESVLQRVAV